MNKTLIELLKDATKHKMTAREIWQQRVSFVYGQLPDNAVATREDVERNAVRVYGPCPEDPVPVIGLAERIGRALLPKPVCRDCADDGPRCPTTGELCDPREAAKELAGLVAALEVEVKRLREYEAYVTWLGPITVEAMDGWRTICAVAKKEAK